MASDNVCLSCGNGTEQIGPKTKLCPGCSRRESNKRRRDSEAARQRRATQVAKERKRKYDAERNARPEIKERTAENYQSWRRLPDVILRRRRQSAERERTPYWQRRRAEQRQTQRYKEKRRERNALREMRPEVRLYRLYRNFVRRRQTVGHFTQADIDRILHLQRHRCAICRVPLRGKRMHIDHITPIARGGTHAPRNLQICCEPCNLKKGSSDPIAHMRKLGRLL